MNRFNMLVILGIFFFPIYGQTAEIYKSIDKNGSISFSDTGPKGEKFEIINVKEGAVIQQPKMIEKAKPAADPANTEDKVNAYLKEMDQKVKKKRQLQQQISILEEELSRVLARMKQIEESRPSSKDGITIKIGRTPVVTSIAPTAEDDEYKRLFWRKERIDGEIFSLESQITEINRSM